MSCNVRFLSYGYFKIKDAHPNIDDETAVKYLKFALHKIRNTKVSNERKKSNEIIIKS